MQDQPVVGVDLVLGGDVLEQCQFHRQRRLALAEPGAVADAEDMRVDGDGRLAKGGVEHHIGGLAADARQRLQRFAVARHLAAMLLEEDAAGLDHVLGLAAEQADGLDVGNETFHPQREDGLRRAGDRVELSRGGVHAHIGGLRRQDHRDQQLEHRIVFELGGGGRHDGGEAMHGLAAGGRVHVGSCHDICAPGDGAHVRAIA